MLVVLAFCAKDKAIAVRLAAWIAELDGVSKHDCLLGVHTDTDSSKIGEILQGEFRHVGHFPIDDTETIYPFIANVMWKRCAQFVAEFEEAQPWLWLEPDAVPLTPDWLDKIEAEYKASGKPFLLDRVITPTSTHHSGIGVYPARVRDYTMQLWNLANIPWDVFFKDDFAPHTKITGLIHDLFYLHLLPNAKPEWPRDTEPSFPDASWLSIIEPGAVLFHRNKDGSLIDRLREKRNSSTHELAERLNADTGKSSSGSQDTRAGDSHRKVTVPPGGSNPSLVTSPESYYEREARVLMEIQDTLRGGGNGDEKRMHDLRPAALLARIAELEAQILEQGRRFIELKLTTQPKVKFTAKAKRTPEQIQAAKERMEKVRGAKTK